MGRPALNSRGRCGQLFPDAPLIIGRAKTKMLMPIRIPFRAGLLLVAVAASSLPLSSAGEARLSFDGRWRVEVVADPGKCSDRYSVAIRVDNGKIRGNFLGARATGKVDESGKLVLRLDVVRATGALAARTGVGQWKSPACNGTWTARRA